MGRKSGFTAVEVERIRQLYVDEGRSISQIAKILGKGSETSVRNALVKAKKRVSYLEVESPHGHDSFLFPEDSYVKGLSSFLEN